MDQRQCPRFPVRFASTFSSANLVRGEGSVLDLSIRGCRIESGLEVAPGTTLDVRVQTAGDAIPVQVQQAVVRWSRPPQFGLEFVTLVAEEWARLQEVVRRIEMEPYQREAEETQKAQASS